MKSTRSIHGKQVAVIHKYQFLQNLTPLELPKDGLVVWPKLFWVNFIEYRPHLSVAGDRLDPIETFQIPVCRSTIIKGQQGRIFEREHRKGRHQGIRERYRLVICAPVLDFLEPRLYQLEQAAGG